MELLSTGGNLNGHRVGSKRYTHPTATTTTPTPTSLLLLQHICMILDVDTTLRHRTQHSARPLLSQPPPTPTPSSNSPHHLMAYSRRNIATPLSRGGNSNAIPNGKSKTSYRNTILAILVLTSLYTAFLYQRGVSVTALLCHE